MSENERESPVVLSLASVRADGWFARLGGGSAAFAQLCQVVGERFVAFSVVAGLRITALQIDARQPDRSMLEFGVGEDGPVQRMSVAEFRRRLANALVADEDASVSLPEHPSAEDLSAYIGVRYVLLAPVLGIELESLRRDVDPPRLGVRVDGVEASLTVDELRDLVRERIRLEAERYRAGAPFSIDLAVVPEAEQAAERGEPERVVALLGGWPGPLALILRTPEGIAIGAEPRAAIVRALGLLGSAYAALGRSDWAEDVLRLGIQWGGDGPAAADLFRRLGEAHITADRPGEAIGVLRRAIALWERAPLGDPDLEARRRRDRGDAYAALARAFGERRRFLASLVCATRASALGASEDTVEPVRRRALEHLGPPAEAILALIETDRGANQSV